MTDIKTLAGQHFVIACDHGGFALKEHVLGYFAAQNITGFTDLGVFSTDSAHFPQQADKAVTAIKNGEAIWAILICGTGIGMSIAANRHAGIYCALCHDVTTARLSREHNNANILAIGGRLIGPTLAEDMIQTFMATPFLAGRYQDRIGMIDPLGC